MRGFERDTLTAVINSKRVWVSHLLSNALLMMAFFYWTHIPEETKLQFVLTVVSGLAIGFLTLWLHGATFHYFQMPIAGRFRNSLRRSARYIPAFLIWTIIFGVLLGLIGQLGIYEEQTGGWIRHLLPAFSRPHVTPQSAMSLISWLAWLHYFFVWPILFLPIGAQVATKGFRGFFGAEGFRPIRMLRFWIAYFICFVIGAYLPCRLVWMVPRRPSPLNEQTWSMATRFGLAYILLITAWFVLCAAMMRASDDERKHLNEPVPVVLQG